MLPEDYAALYLQYAATLHRVDPNLKLGGPSFQGVNQDIDVWPDAQGRTSWLSRFLEYLRQHGRMQDLQFFSFEHYPYKPCRISWANLYDEPELISHIMQVWRNDGLPKDLPIFLTESHLSSSTSETYVDIFGGLWLADYLVPTSVPAATRFITCTTCRLSGNAAAMTPPATLGCSRWVWTTRSNSLAADPLCAIHPRVARR